MTTAEYNEIIRLFYPAGATKEQRDYLDDKVDADLEENGYGMGNYLEHEHEEEL